MPYCALDDLKKIVADQDLIQLTDDHIPPRAIVTANVDRAIADAGELIDGYLRNRYSLPLSPLPGIIGTLAGDIAVYRLYARRATIAPPEGVAERYKNALKLLERIQEGKITLGASIITSPEGSANTVSVSSADRVFTRDSLKGF
jgi:phage gp36-like protein